MPEILVRTRSGAVIQLQGTVGASLMEVIRENGIEDIQAVCGGCASCATCHVYVDRMPVQSLTTMSDQEDDLLDSSIHRAENSRLCCQIAFSDELDGLHITIAPEE